MSDVKELEVRGTQGVFCPLDILGVQPDFNPRSEENLKPDDGLKNSIKENGILKPVHIRPNEKKPGHYWIVDGERRYRVAKELKLKEIPVVPATVEDDISALVVALIGNDNSKPLTTKERAVAFQRLKDGDVDKDEIARLMSCSIRTVEETLRVLESDDEEVKEAVTTDKAEEKIPVRAAARVVDLPKDTRKAVVKEIKGKSQKDAVKVVQKAEKEAGIKRRGRQAKDYPWARDAKARAELLEKAAKSLIRKGEAGGRRAEHHLEVIEVLKGKKEAGELYVALLEQEAAKSKKKAPSKKKVAKKVSKKKLVKKTALKKKSSKKKAAKSKVSQIRKAAPKKASKKKGARRKKNAA